MYNIKTHIATLTSAAILVLFFPNTIYAENPFDEAKLTFSLTNLSVPKIYTKESDLLDYSLRPTWGASFLLDVPIWRYLHSGFMVRYLASPKKGDIGGIVDLGAVLKPSLGFESPIGHVAFYLTSVAGLSVTFMPVINKSFVLSEEELRSKDSIKKHVNVFGGLLNASVKFGVEYYPMSQFACFCRRWFCLLVFPAPNRRKAFPAYF